MKNNFAASAFVSELRALAIDVDVSDALIARLRENCSALSVPVIGLAVPADKNQLAALVAVANRYRVPLSVYSRGTNWGFGSRAPYRAGCLLVELSRLNRILKIDPVFGYAVIEAGVSQGQLYQALRDRAPDWYFDVTGSSSHSSIVGNALERGVAYNAQRVNLLSDLEVITGAGRLMRTGCGQFPTNEMTNLYRHGVGPALDGLFYQSNFGIVTQATVNLTRRPEHHDFVSIGVSSFAQVPELIESLGGLLRDNVVQCIPHVFNRQRFVPTMAPLWRLQMEQRGYVFEPHEVERRFSQAFPGEWFAVLGVGCSRDIVRSVRARIRAALPRGLKANFLSGEDEARQIRRNRWLPGNHAQRAAFEAARPMRNMVRGVPTDETLQSIGWEADKMVGRVSADDLDRLAGGFIFCTPFAPLTAKDASQMVAITERIGAKFGFAPAISLNLIDRKILEGVLSVHFDKRQPARAQAAQECVRTMLSEFIRVGYVPYRFDVGSMDLFGEMPSVAAPLLKQLKQVFDPNGILAPGRYESWSNSEGNALLDEGPQVYS